MKLVIFGLTVSSSWGNGHATIWRGLCGALANAGHQVVFYERDVPYYSRHRDFTGNSHYDLVLYEEWEEIARRAKSDAADSDCAMVTSYCPDARAAADLILDCQKPVRAFYDLDTPVTLDHLFQGQEVEYVPTTDCRPSIWF